MIKRLRSALRVLQFLPDTQELAGYASDGSRINRTHMDVGRTPSVRGSARRTFMPTRSQLKNLLVLIACCIAAYLSFVSYGGYLVFGFHSFSEFCLIGVPLFAFPVAVLGFRYTLASTALFLAIITLYFGVQMYHIGPPWSAVLHNGTQFYKFLSVNHPVGRGCGT